MKRSALIGAALAALLAAVFAVGVSVASASAPPTIHYTPLYVSIADGSGVEGAFGVMRITAWGSLPRGVTADVYWSTTTGGTGTAGFDYAAQSGSYAMGTGSVNCLVNSIDDTIYEPNRTFKVHIWSDDPLVVVTRGTATFTILDNDPIPKVSIGDAGTVTEGSALTFPITLSNPGYLPVSVSLARGAGTSANFDDNDVTGHSTASPTIPAYSTAGTSFVIQTKDDSVYEGPETVVVHLSSATNATIGTANGTGVLNDNDPMPVVHISDAGHAHHGSPLVFALSLSGQSQLPVNVSLERIVVGHGSSGTATVTFPSMVTSAAYSYDTHLDHWWDACVVTMHLAGADNAALPGGLSNWAYGFGIW
jgi:Calx-beta domain